MCIETVQEEHPLLRVWRADEWHVQSCEGAGGQTEAAGGGAAVSFPQRFRGFRLIDYDVNDNSVGE